MNKYEVMTGGKKEEVCAYRMEIEREGEGKVHQPCALFYDRQGELIAVYFGFSCVQKVGEGGEVDGSPSVDTIDPGPFIRPRAPRVE